MAEGYGTLGYEASDISIIRVQGVFSEKRIQMYRVFSNLKPMTTTSEKILSEMERMGRMKIKDLCAQMHWQYQKFRRRIKANDFSPEDLALIATSMNILQPYLPPTSVEALTGDPPLPDVLEINGVKYRKVRE